VSWVAIAVAASSIVVMPLLARAKQRIGAQLYSAATAGEGAQNILCAYLGAAVLAGLTLNAAFGLWWADPAVALGIAALAVHEGRETWRGDDCCATYSAESAKPRGLAVAQSIEAERRIDPRARRPAEERPRVGT
jgi:hypothetical protein